MQVLRRVNWLCFPSYSNMIYDSDDSRQVGTAIILLRIEHCSLYLQRQRYFTGPVCLHRTAFQMDSWSGTTLLLFTIIMRSKHLYSIPGEGGGGGGGGGAEFPSPQMYLSIGRLYTAVYKTCTPLIYLGVQLSTAVYSYCYSSSAGLTSLLHLTMHAGPLELGPNSQALILFLWSQARASK